MKLQVIFSVVLMASMVHALGGKSEGEIETEICAAVDSLRVELVQLSSKYSELADTKNIRIEGSLTGTPYYGFDYYHNCKYWGKRGHEETGPDSIHVGFRVVRPSNEDYYVMVERKAPEITWPSLNLVGFTERYYGKEPASQIGEEIETLLQKTMDRITQLNQSMSQKDIEKTNQNTDRKSPNSERATTNSQNYTVALRPGGEREINVDWETYLLAKNIMGQSVSAEAKPGTVTADDLLKECEENDEQTRKKVIELLESRGYLVHDVAGPEDSG